MRVARILAACAMFAVLALSPVSGLHSQDKKSKSRGQLPSGWSKLNLTASQREQVYQLQADHKDAVAKLKAEIAKLDAELVKKRLAVLTEAQRKKLRESVGGEEPPAKGKNKGNQ